MNQDGDARRHVMEMNKKEMIEDGVANLESRRSSHFVT